MSDDPTTTYERARKAAGLDPVGDHVDAYMAQATGEGNLDDDLRLKMRYKYVCGRLDSNPANPAKWEAKRRELEEELMDAGIRPSTLLDNTK